MIQRIQSVYLVVGAILVAVFAGWPALRVSTAAAAQAWYYPTVAGGALFVVALAVGAIFLYKDRKKQQRLVQFVQWATLLVLAVALAGMYLGDRFQQVAAAGENVTLVVGLVLPLLGYIFFSLARRSIRKDIELVRSMDRLR